MKYLSGFLFVVGAAIATALAVLVFAVPSPVAAMAPVAVDPASEVPNGTPTSQSHAPPISPAAAVPAVPAAQPTQLPKPVQRTTDPGRSNVLKAGFSLVDKIDGTGWDALQPSEWGTVCYELLDVARAIEGEGGEFAELRLRANLAGGRALENANDTTHDGWRLVGDRNVNWPFYVAAAMVHQTPSLAQNIERQQYLDALARWQAFIEAGDLPATPPADPKRTNQPETIIPDNPAK